MTAPKTEAPPPAILFPVDFEIIAKLLPRAQIVVGDVASILGTLQRLNAAHQSKAYFTEVRHNAEAPDDKAAG